MREIKFSVWAATDTGLQMVYLDTIDCDNGLWFSSKEHIDDYKEAIMQYTGEPDETGKDIYEGDVVEEEVETEYGKDKIKHEVSFNAGAFYPICMQPSTTSKFIGNVHENPELKTW